MAEQTPKQRVQEVYPHAVCEPDEDGFGFLVWTDKQGSAPRYIVDPSFKPTPQKAWEQAAKNLPGAKP